MRGAAAWCCAGLAFRAAQRGGRTARRGTHVVAVLVEVVDGAVRGLLRRGRAASLRRGGGRPRAHPVFAATVAGHRRLLLPDVQRARALAARHCTALACSVRLCCTEARRMISDETAPGPALAPIVEHGNRRGGVACRHAPLRVTRNCLSAGKYLTRLPASPPDLHQRTHRPRRR